MYGSHRHLCGAGGAAAVFETVATHNSKPASGPLSTHKTALYSIAIVLLTALPGTMQTLAQQPAQQQSAQQPSTQQPGAQLAQSQAGQIPMLQPPSQGFTYPERQTLIYTVDWRVFTAGTAVFHLEQQGDVQKITASGDSVGAVTMLFPVVDTFQAGFNTRTGCSTGFSKQLLEGRRRVSSDLTFDYTAGRQHQVEKNLVKRTQKEQTASIPACVTDSLSAIFYAASQPMVVGQSFKFPLADSMRTVTVTMKVEAKEEIKTPAGTFQTIRVQPTADEGIVKNRGNIWIWYTDDARHMPVQIRARLFWGTITAHLQSYDAK